MKKPASSAPEPPPSAPAASRAKADRSGPTSAQAGPLVRPSHLRRGQRDQGPSEPVPGLKYDGPKGVVFTHITISGLQVDDLADPNKADAYVEEQAAFCRGFLACKNVGLVYLFINLGLRELEAERDRKSFSMRLKTAGRENRVKGLLLRAERRAREDFRGSTRSEPHQIEFVHVGIGELVDLLNALIEIDPLLVTPVAGPGGVFTYDSPKFLEAALRLARGVDPRLCRQPIVRMDADVLPCGESIDLLLSEAQNRMREGEKYFFFSGGYTGARRPDPISQHAVRTHWFFAGIDPERHANRWTMAARGCNRFLADLGQVGAVQLTEAPEWGFLASGEVIERSEKGEQHATDRAGRRAPGRRSPQVISGAGLIMSYCCILELPPFLNTPHMVVWVDDHLKRRLHERLNHIARNDAEAFAGARFVQDRGAGDVPWARRVYFERLFRGCLMHGLVVEGEEKSGSLEVGELSYWVARAARGEIRRSVSDVKGEELFDRRNDGYCDRSGLIRRFAAVAKQHGDALLEIWKASASAYGNTTLADWAAHPVCEAVDPVTKKKIEKPIDLKDIYRSTAEDAYQYIVLVADWWDYVRAIFRLSPDSAPWLFKTAG